MSICLCLVIIHFCIFNTHTHTQISSFRKTLRKNISWVCSLQTHVVATFKFNTTIKFWIFVCIYSLFISASLTHTHIHKNIYIVVTTLIQKTYLRKTKNYQILSICLCLFIIHTQYLTVTFTNVVSTWSYTKLKA